MKIKPKFSIYVEDDFVFTKESCERLAKLAHDSMYLELMVRVCDRQGHQFEPHPAYGEVCMLCHLVKATA